MAVRVTHAKVSGKTYTGSDPDRVGGQHWDADHTIADLTIPGSLTLDGAYAVTVRLGGATDVTLPQSGTLATTADVAAGYQPLDSDLTAIAALTTTSTGRSLLAIADAAAGRTILSAQAQDADLDTIAALSPSNDDFLQRKAGAWANRTVAQVLADLAAAGTTFQPLDSDLTAIAALTTTSTGRSLLEIANAAAGRTILSAQAQDSDLDAIAALSPSNDDVLQRKAGAWTNRTIAQLLTDLAAPGTTFQPLDSDLTAIAALSTTTFGRALLALADAAALRTAAGLGTAATQNTGTSGANVPLLNTSVTWSGGSQVFANTAAGAVLSHIYVQTTNSASGETHAARFSTQDDNAGTIRTLFYCSANLDTGTANQGIMEFFTENGGLRIARFDSLVANSATRLFLYDRSGNIRAQLKGDSASSTNSTSGALILTGGAGVSENITAGGSIKSASATAGVGYGSGAGGTVTQSTSKSTGVTLDKVCGQITMNNAALNAGTSVSFTLTNSAIASTDTVRVNIQSGATADSYNVDVTAVAAGSCRIQVRNFTAGNLSEALVLNFAVIKGVTS